MNSVVSSTTRRGLGAVLACWALLGFNTTFAYALDIQPEGFVDVNGGQAFTDQDAFGFFVQDLADAIISTRFPSGTSNARPVPVAPLEVLDCGSRRVGELA